MCPSIKILNLSKIELRSIAKKQVLVVTKVCQKMNLQFAINATSISKPTKNKEKEIKKSLIKPSKKRILESKRKDIKKIS